MSGQYRTIHAKDAGRLLWTLLKEILLDPSKGWQVREFILPYDRQAHWDPVYWPWSHRAPGFEKCPEEDVAIFTAAARELRRLYLLKARIASERL